MPEVNWMVKVPGLRVNTPALLEDNSRHLENMDDAVETLIRHYTEDDWMELQAVLHSYCYHLRWREAILKAIPTA
jgi:hypothetical protein